MESCGILLCIQHCFCPDMDRMAVRAMGRTDATPYMECVDAHWSAISAWTEDSADLGDADEFEEGDEPLSSDDEDEDDNVDDA